MTATIEELSERFHATYVETDESGEEGTEAMGVLNEDEEPFSLYQVSFLCQVFNLDADLFDSKGNKRGWVHSTGRSSVGDGQ